MISTLKYTLTRGVLWERLVVIKNRRTRRILKVEEARCMVQAGATKINIPVTITNEGGIMLRLEPDATWDLPNGELAFDVAAPVRGYWMTVAQGTITVSTLDTVTPSGDAQDMEIRFKRGEDYRNSFAWSDTEGVIQTVTDAYMQAKDSTGTTVIDLRWFATKPNEAAVLALPAIQRGYLAPYPEESLELHISDANSVPAGTYSFDLFVKGVEGDWVFLAGGTIVVEASVSSRPT